jgi:hypothetical protein
MLLFGLEILDYFSSKTSDVDVLVAAGIVTNVCQFRSLFVASKTVCLIGDEVWKQEVQVWKAEMISVEVVVFEALEMTFFFQLFPFLMNVLSIQSHVVHGYVGNKASTFPLQLLGFEVDPLNTVQFSNHKRYPNCTGMTFNADHFREICNGLIGNDFVQGYSHLLTGYIGVPNAIDAIAAEIKRLKEINPNIKVIVDPVLGDDGRLYVDAKCVPCYTRILSLADITTPNGFEAE